MIMLKKYNLENIDKIYYYFLVISSFYYPLSCSLIGRQGVYTKTWKPTTLFKTLEGSACTEIYIIKKILMSSYVSCIPWNWRADEKSDISWTSFSVSADVRVTPPLMLVFPDKPVSTLLVSRSRDWTLVNISKVWMLAKKLRPNSLTWRLATAVCMSFTAMLISCNSSAVNLIFVEIIVDNWIASLNKVSLSDRLVSSPTKEFSNENSAFFNLRHQQIPVEDN